MSVPQETPESFDWSERLNEAAPPLIEEGDYNALCERLNVYRGEILRVLALRHRLRPEDAEDLLQDVQAGLMTTFRSYNRKKGAFTPWFLVVCKNQAIDRERSASKKKKRLPDIWDLELREALAAARARRKAFQDEDSPPSIEEQAMRDVILKLELSEDVLDLLSEDRTPAEIAERCAWTAGYARVKKGRLRLKVEALYLERLAELEGRGRG